MILRPTYLGDRILAALGNPSNAQVPTYDAIKGVYTPQDVGFSGITADDIIITDYTKGLVLTSPDGTRWRITVDNSGVLSTAPLTPSSGGQWDFDMAANSGQLLTVGF